LPYPLSSQETMAPTVSQSEIPSEFMCPITREAMKDPVSAADGYTYEREAITSWLKRTQQPLSPMTGAVLEHAFVIPNQIVKNMITEWYDKQVIAAAARERESSLKELTPAQSTEVRGMLQKAFGWKKGRSLVVERVLKIENAAATGRFNAKKAELQTARGSCPVVTKFHGTSLEAAEAIARGGFKLPQADDDGDFLGKGVRVELKDAEEDEEGGAGGSESSTEAASREPRMSFLMFGQAVYVSSDLDKVTRFAEGTMLVVDCALGKTQEARKAEYNLTEAKMKEKGFDSVTALAGCQGEGGCRFEEYALYHPDQVLPTHLVHFKIVKTGGGAIQAQRVADTGDRVEAKSRTLRDILDQFSVEDATPSQIDEKRIAVCAWLGSVARDDQEKATRAFLSDDRLVRHLAVCARTSNEALQFMALRAWGNFCYGHEQNQTLAMENLGIHLILFLLENPNPGIRIRAVGIIWTLTHRSPQNRMALLGGGVVPKLAGMLEAAIKPERKPWNVLRLLFGALANLSVGGGDEFPWELMFGAALRFGDEEEEKDAPTKVREQAIRLVCNRVNNGVVPVDWARNGFTALSSVFIPEEQVDEEEA